MTLKIRDAASLILWRDRSDPKVLMGQRGAQAAFLPSKMVFPGGAVDPGDAEAGAAGRLDPVCRTRLGLDAAQPPEAFAATAIRELAEESGLLLGRPAPWPDAQPGSWRRFSTAGLRPDLDALTFVFRAVTPPGRPRRFDARFFLAPAEAVAGDLDDFGHAEDELSGLRWVRLADTRALDLPFITEVILAEITPLIGAPGPPARVPFFKNGAEEDLFRWLQSGGPRPDQYGIG